MTSDLLIGNRIPRDYFVTKGKGESDITIHAGSYHLALKDARIENFNIMTYSSILPKIATQISQPLTYVHGAVMESIMAVANGKKGERLTAGILWGWLYHKETGEKFGGLVCEHNGNYTEEEIKEKLKASINELYVNGFDDQYDLLDCFFSCQTSDWQAIFLSRLEAMSIKELMKTRENEHQCLSLLDNAKKFHDKRRVKKLLNSWAKDLTELVAKNENPEWTPNPLSPEEILLRAIFGENTIISPSGTLKEINSILKELETWYENK